VTSIEVAEITATARNAEAQIAELASHSTDDGTGRHSPPQQSNHHGAHHDIGDHDDGGKVSTPDGNIRPVQPTFFTIPHGLSLIDVHCQFEYTVQLLLLGICFVLGNVLA